MDESGVLSPPLATRPLGPFPTDERSTISASAAVKGLAVAREDRLAVPRCPQKGCLGRSRYWESPRSGTVPPSDHPPKLIGPLDRRLNAAAGVPQLTLGGKTMASAEGTQQAAAANEEYVNTVADDKASTAVKRYFTIPGRD